MNRHNHVPEASQAVDVDDDDKDQLEELQGVFHVLSHVHTLDNTPQS